MENIAELFISLDAQLDQQTITAIAAMSEPEAQYRLHFSVNALIRSLVFHQNLSLDSKRFFYHLGMPDDVSDVLGRLYWHRVRGDRVTVDLVAGILSHSLYMLPEHVLRTAQLLVSQLGDESSE